MFMFTYHRPKMYFLARRRFTRVLQKQNGELCMYSLGITAVAFRAVCKPNIANVGCAYW